MNMKKREERAQRENSDRKNGVRTPRGATTVMTTAMMTDANY